jgi:hypothetical protein
MLFADGIRDAHVANGVVRLTLAMLGGDGKPAASGVVILPLTQLPAFASTILRLAQQVEARLREAQQAQQQQPGAAGDGFRLGS